MNSEKGKISLGLKQNQPEPWSVINDKYEVGQVVRGKVVQIKEYGAFVELEPGSGRTYTFRAADSGLETLPVNLRRPGCFR